MQPETKVANEYFCKECRVRISPRGMCTNHCKFDGAEVPQRPRAEVIVREWTMTLIRETTLDQVD